MTILINDTAKQTVELTDERINQAYEDLGLNEPGVREFYEDLRSLRQQQEQQFWLRTSHHTSIPQK